MCKQTCIFHKFSGLEWLTWNHSIQIKSDKKEVIFFCGWHGLLCFIMEKKAVPEKKKVIFQIKLRYSHAMPIK